MAGWEERPVMRSPDPVHVHRWVGRSTGELLLASDLISAHQRGAWLRHMPPQRRLEPAGGRRAPRGYGINAPGLRAAPLRFLWRWGRRRGAWCARALFGDLRRKCAIKRSNVGL
jgi:hypothetical protein